MQRLSHVRSCHKTGIFTRLESFTNSTHKNCHVMFNEKSTHKVCHVTVNKHPKHNRKITIFSLLDAPPKVRKIEIVSVCQNMTKMYDIMNYKSIYHFSIKLCSRCSKIELKLIIIDNQQTSECKPSYASKHISSYI